MTPQVSVIVTARNQELYVERCLGSLARQSLEAFEVLVVDGGSTDDTPHRIADFTQRDPRFRRLVYTPQHWASPLHLGLERAQADFVLWLDVRDWLEVTACELLSQQARTAQADVVVSDVVWVFETHQERTQPVDRPHSADLSAADLLRQPRWGPWLVRREQLEQAGLAPFSCDLGLFLTVALTARRVSAVEAPLSIRDLSCPAPPTTQADVLEVAASLRFGLSEARRRGRLQPFQPELLHFALHHVVLGLDRARGLSPVERAEAVRRLFAVLDDFFGSTWLGPPLEAVVSRRLAEVLRWARPLGYRPLAWTWALERELGRARHHLGWAKGLPQRAWRRARRLISPA